MILNLHQDFRRRGEVCTRFRWGNLREKDHLEDLGVDRRIILSGMWEHGMNRAGLGQGQETGICKCSNERAGSITFLTS
jgi:hypothetical protein